MRIGKLIRDARRAKDLTQAELAVLLFTHEKTVGKWERGVAKPHPKTLALLEQHLGVRLVNRPEDIRRVRVAQPSELTTAELGSALLAYTAELIRRQPMQDISRPIDLEMIVREGWSATRLSDLEDDDQGETSGA